MDPALQKWMIGAIDSDTLAVPGYTRLIDSPDVLAAIGGLADIISNATIQLMRNTDDGDVRVRNQLARFMDISPWRHGTRKDLISWIVWTMLTTSTGSAFLLPHTERGLLSELEPMPGAYALSDDNGLTYYVMWQGRRYTSDSVLHFKRWPDPAQPWQGIGLRISLRDVTANLRQAAATKKGFMSDKWKPSVIVKVDALADEFADEAGRKRLVDQYMSGSSAGEPWVIPAELMEVQQVKPLSLTDLAIKDSVELDKREVASLVGVTPYMVGVGSYSDAEHNHMIRTTAVTISNIICQELTRKLLISEEMYFQMSTRRLYSYTLQELASVADDQYIRGLMDGNEARDWLGLSPRKGLNELVILENYIPRGMIGNQKKLEGGDGNAE
jgi:HK97 family phage portal protein